MIFDINVVYFKATNKIIYKSYQALIIFFKIMISNFHLFTINFLSFIHFFNKDFIIFNY